MRRPASDAGEPVQRLTRRDFLTVSALATGGMLVACRTSDEASPAEGGQPARAREHGPVPFGAYVEITADNRVHIWCPQSEMGQGVHLALPKIVAEELDADWKLVEVRLPHASDVFVNPVTRRQRTANSDSVITYYELLRKAGAGARELLLAAAARHWNVSVSELTTAASHVRHEPSGRRATYGELASQAAALPPPASPALKQPAQFALIGRTLPRKDTPAKCDGSATFGIDVRGTGMLYAAIRRSPAIGAKTVRFDRDGALAMPGVVDAFEITDGIAVVADSTWRAMKAADAVTAEFDTASVQRLETEAIRARMRAALDDDGAALPARVPAPGSPPYDREAALAALARAPRSAELIYEVPFLAHAALEPLSCTALVDDDRCEVWAPTQQPDRSLELAAQLTGLPRDRIRLHVTLLGGGFGRKWEVDFVGQAVEIARRVRKRPVKLTWTREQDFQHDRFRPAHLVRTRIGLSRDGRILAMHSRTTGISMWKYQGRPPLPGVGDPFATGLLINDRYGIPVRYVDYVETDFPIPVGTWRSVSQSMNGFFSESAIDDAAALTGQDPYRMRRAMLGGDARAVRVLDVAASKARWDTPLPRGRGRGIAIGMSFASYCAQVVEVSVERSAVKVERVVCAFDCGTVIDPGGVEAQLEGGIVWGLSAARDGTITFANGAARETNFDRSPILRIDDCPPIEIHLVPSGDPPGGAGEASVPPVAPALAGAIHAATGRRPRRLPIIASGFELAS